MKQLSELLLLQDPLITLMIYFGTTRIQYSNELSACISLPQPPMCA
jgi:hypothetical protein